jgi:hypothetical protein
MKTSMQILYNYIVEMEDNYMKMSKKSKDKDFKKGVDAILTATTLIRVQIGDGGFQLEKKQIIEAGNACISKKRKSHELISKMSDDELLSEMKKGFTTYGEEYYEQTYNQKK